MKNKFILLAVAAVLSFHFKAPAQDSTQHSAIRKIHTTSGTADKLQGKKIQQQTLSAKSVEKLGTVATTTSQTNTTKQGKKKTGVKPKRKKS